MTLGTLFYPGHAPEGAAIPVMHQHLPGMSRRSFLRAAGAAGGLAVGSRWLWPTVASATPKASATPRPIPEGLPGSVFDPGNTHFFHILPPVGPQMGQYVEPITITDFKGKVGRCHVIGTGTGTPRTSNSKGAYAFDVDMGFMQGSFVGSDGREHHGTFGFL
jgi:hypothetical protein